MRMEIDLCIKNHFSTNYDKIMGANGFCKGAEKIKKPFILKGLEIIGFSLKYLNSVYQADA